MHLAIVIPVYNEQKVIGSVINGLPKQIKGINKIEILAVNDGSTDSSVREIKKTRAKLISHVVNLGYGAASTTGLEGAKKIGVDIAVTFDGDGQHDPNDIEKVIAPILANKSDVIIGTRFHNIRSMPILKRIGIKGLNFIIFLFSGHWSTDSQCGLKAFSSRALDKMELETTGMEFASEVILEARKRRLRIKEISAKTIYTRYSRKKGQSPLNGINIVLKMVAKKLAIK